MWPQTKEASNHQNLEEAWSRFSLKAFVGNVALVEDFWLLNCEGINIHYYKPQMCGVCRSGPGN